MKALLTFLILFLTKLSSQEPKRIGVAIFSPYKIASDANIEEKIFNNLKSKLEKNNFSVSKMKKSSSNENLSTSRKMIFCFM